MLADAPNVRSALPTDGQIKQEENQTYDKEAGIKPKKRPTRVEDDSDDCGDDLKGLGDAALLAVVLVGMLESDKDDSLVLTLPSDIADARAGVFTIVPALFYGRGSCVDMLEPCRGTGGISQLAFQGNRSSGGNLDKGANVDLCSPR
eukprot:9271394-Pyramimonas_sp.AAC.1